MTKVLLSCDRCGAPVEGIHSPIATAGFYEVSDGIWAKYGRDGEHFVCDGCIQSSPAYRLDYGFSWVSQQHLYGCGLAVLAMLTGRSYDTVKDDVDEMEEPRDWSKSGCSHYTLDRYLAREGWFLQRRYADDWRLPQEPFARIHYAQVVQPSGNHHFVVVLEDGGVLDPMVPFIRRELSDWSKVNQLVGLTA